MCNHSLFMMGHMDMMFLFSPPSDMSPMEEVSDYGDERKHWHTQTLALSILSLQNVLPVYFITTAGNYIYTKSFYKIINLHINNSIVKSFLSQLNLTKQKN
ncbi:hypothetical protein ACI65C_010548 [Semiaphis heraclei]